MYQRKSNLLNVMIMILDCLCITVSLILANYIRNGKAFVSDNERMDFSLMLGGCLVAFLAWNLYKNLYKDMFLRGPFSELLHIIGLHPHVCNPSGMEKSVAFPLLENGTGKKGTFGCRQRKCSGAGEKREKHGWFWR